MFRGTFLLNGFADDFRFPKCQSVYFAISSLESGRLQKWERYLRSYRLERMDKMKLKNFLNEIAVVAALLLPVNFTATLSVPGGYDNSTGKPNLFKLFNVKLFIITNVISFMAAVSILILRTFEPGSMDLKTKIRRATLSIFFMQLALGTTVLAYISAAFTIFGASEGFIYASLIVCVYIVMQSAFKEQDSFGIQFGSVGEENKQNY